VRLVLPDVAIAVVSLMSLRSMSSLEDTPASLSLLRSPLEHDAFLVVALIIPAVSFPSLLSFVYMCSIFIVVVPWARRGVLAESSSLAVIVIPLLVYTAANMMLFYLYQIEFFQNSASVSTAQLFGLVSLVDCSVVSQDADNLALHLGNFTWPAWLHPISILMLYFVLVSCCFHEFPL
jgi:hypothetical protein